MEPYRIYQAAPCWVATTLFGRFAFVSNTGSNSVSSYYVAPGGKLFLINKAAASTDNAPADIVVAANNFYVYELNVDSGTIGEFHSSFLAVCNPSDLFQDCLHRLPGWSLLGAGSGINADVPVL